LAPVYSLVLRKISKIGASRYQILRLKCTKFAFRRGSAPHPLGELRAPPGSLTVFKGPASKGREGKGTGREGEGKGERRRGKWMERFFPPKNLGVSSPIHYGELVILQ